MEKFFQPWPIGSQPNACVLSLHLLLKLCRCTRWFFSAKACVFFSCIDYLLKLCRCARWSFSGFSHFRPTILARLICFHFLFRDYKEYHTDTTVKFTVKMAPEKLARAEEMGIHKFFKLQTSMSTNTMVSWDSEF